MQRNITLDILKIVLASMVVAMHSGFLDDISNLGHYITVNGFFRIAVPIFVLINGFYFYNNVKQKTILNWFKRVFFLYLFWMFFYSYFWFKLNSPFHTISSFIIGYFHLWYLPGMIAAASILLLLKNLSLKVIITTIIITFFTGVAIQYFGNYHIINNDLTDSIFNRTYVHRNFLLFVFPFFFIGYLINKFNVKEIMSLKLSIVLAAVGLCLLLIESYLNFIHPLRDGGFDNFVSLILVCPAIFLLAIKFKIPSQNKELSYYATGIYFIHPIFLRIYPRIFILDETILTFLTIISSGIASYFLIKINRKLKVILWLLITKILKSIIHYAYLHSVIIGLLLLSKILTLEQKFG